MTNRNAWPWCDECRSWHDPENPTCRRRGVIDPEAADVLALMFVVLILAIVTIPLWAPALDQSTEWLQRR